VGVEWVTDTRGGRWNGGYDSYHPTGIIELVKSETIGFSAFQMVSVESVEPPIMPPSKTTTLPESIMEIVQTMAADVLETVAMNDSETQTEVVLSETE
jgi:hypothetical protein